MLSHFSHVWLCDPMDCIPPGSSVQGISQARILEWVTISFFRGSSQPRVRTSVFCIGRWILYHRATRETLVIYIPVLNSHLQGSLEETLACLYQGPSKQLQGKDWGSIFSSQIGGLHAWLIWPLNTKWTPRNMATLTTVAISVRPPQTTYS